MKSSLLNSVLRHQSGSTTIVFGAAALALVGAIGGAIDYNRYAAARRATQSAVDAAVLAGARTLLMNPDNTSAAITAAASYYTSNIAGRATLANDTIAFQVTDNNSAVTATGEAWLQTSFLRVLGIPQIKVASAAGAGFPKGKILMGGGSNLEVSVMLDVTGSMCAGQSVPCTSSSKMDAMKDGAKDLVDIVVRSEQTPYYSKVALVPFAARVRVGPDGGGGAMMQTLTDLDPTWTGWFKTCTDGSGGSEGEGQSNWQCNAYEAQHKENWKIMPCVTDRYREDTGYDYTDSAPGAGAWFNAHDGRRMPVGRDSSDTPATTKLGVTPADPAEHWNYRENGACSQMDDANEIMPLSSDKSALKTKIDSLEADGSTAGALGTAFAWYMLSPNWASIWTGNSAPAPYSELTETQANGAPKLRKVAVLMSDGVFNTYRSWNGQNQQDMSNYAKQMCTNMKAQGIEIYTVGFALDQLSAGERTIAEDTLLSCGTTVDHFYNSLTPAELASAFQDIGVKLSSISLSK